MRLIWAICSGESGGGGQQREQWMGPPPAVQLKP